jgi:hypothetical protein
MKSRKVTCGKHRQLEWLIMNSSYIVRSHFLSAGVEGYMNLKAVGDLPAYLLPNIFHLLTFSHVVQFFVDRCESGWTDHATAETDREGGTVKLYAFYSQ